MLADHVAELAATQPTNVVRLLLAFDQWVVCASRRVGPRSRPGPGEPALDPLHRTRIYRLQGWVSPVLPVNGRIEGVWKHKRKGRRLLVEVDVFRRMGALATRSSTCSTNSSRLRRWLTRPVNAAADAGSNAGRIAVHQVRQLVGLPAKRRAMPTETTRQCPIPSYDGRSDVLPGQGGGG